MIGNTTTEFEYEMQGLRLSKTTTTVNSESGNGATPTSVTEKIRYAYNNSGLVISEANASNQVTASYVWGPDRLLAKRDVSTNKKYYYLYNGHGDVVQIIDESGNIVNNYQYDEWGNILQQQEGIDNAFKYAGEIQDEETGLYYLRARYYDPSVGRFISKDTYEGQINNPLSLNLYTYGHNNPLLFIDPSGHKVVFSQNQYDYLEWLQRNGNSGQKKWATQQLRAGMAYYDTEKKQIVSGCFDCASEDNSPIYDFISGVGGGAKGLVVGASKAIAKQVTKQVTKQAAKDITYKLSNNAIDHIGKHIVSNFQNQVKYLTKEQLDKKLKKTSFFNPNWTERQIISYVEKGYSEAMSNGVRGLYEYKVKGEVIQIFIKQDGTFDTAYGLHKLTSSYFGK